MKESEEALKKKYEPKYGWGTWHKCNAKTRARNDDCDCLQVLASQIEPDEKPS